MSLTKEQILDAIAEMSVMEVVELVSALEEKFGVSAAVAAVAVAGGATEAAEEKTEFDVVLTGFENKVGAIKAVRTATGLGLKEAKELVESAPAKIKEGVSKAEAEELQKALEAGTCKVEIK